MAPLTPLLDSSNSIPPGTNNSTMPSTTTTKVLDTPELLETIISLLSDREIYNNAQKVSRTWKATIAASPRLLRKSWQRKSRRPAVSPARFTEGLGLVTEFDFESIYATPLQVNSLLANGSRVLTEDRILKVSFYRDWIRPSIIECRFTITKRKRVDMADEKREPAAGEGWRWMQICDPPVTEVKTSIHYAPCTSEETMVYDKGGITMGTLYETGVAALRNRAGAGVIVARFWFENGKAESAEEIEERATAGDHGGDLDSDGGDSSDEDSDGDDEADDGDDGSSSEGDDGDGQVDDGSSSQEDDDDDEEDGLNGEGEEGHSEESHNEDDDGEEEEYGSGEITQSSPREEPVMPTVFDIPELLENIISFLPHKDILINAQRVARAWQASVVASPRIQRKLFQRKGKQPAVSPVRLLEPFFQYCEEDALPIYKEPLVIKPLLTGAPRRLNHSVFRWQNGQDSQSVDPDSLEPLDGAFGPQKTHVFELHHDPKGDPAISLHLQQSWRTMQLCDPPITMANLETREDMRFCGDDNTTLSDKDGIKMGLAFDTALLRQWEIFGEAYQYKSWYCVLRFAIEEIDPDDESDEDIDSESDGDVDEST